MRLVIQSDRHFGRADAALGDEAPHLLIARGAQGNHEVHVERNLDLEGQSGINDGQLESGLPEDLQLPPAAVTTALARNT